MPPLYPWSLETMDYDGCCSHSALAEGVLDDFSSLTPEQMAAKELEIEQRQKEQRRVRNLATYHDLKRLDFTEWKARQAAKAAKIGPEKRLQYSKTTRTNTKASRKYACETCDVGFESSFDLNLHNNTKKHIDRVSGTYRVSKNVASKKHHCRICDRSFNDSSKLNEHKMTKKHVDKARGVNGVVKVPQQETWSSSNVAAKKHHCKICDHSFPTSAKLEIHKKSKKHVDNAAKAAESTKSSS